jgi:alpha-tubulin suppressor-like RCC1 family protein
MDCLQHHHQDWRIGDVNTMLTGPRDQWRQFTWGNAERFSLYDKSEKAMRTPNQTLEIRETIILHDSRRRPLPIEREAKFIQVASGKYHTLMLTGKPHITKRQREKVILMGHWLE